MKFYNQFKKKWVYFLFIPIVSCLALFLLLYSMVWMEVFGPVPGSDEIRFIQDQQPSQIFTSDGVLIGTYPIQDGFDVSLEDMSQDMINALIAIEDIRYYRHNGIDYRALGRVFVRTILLRQNAGGGSTITQQLAKNLYPRSNKRGIYLLTDKLREMIIASRLESVYSKDEVLSIYLNNISFGENTFGIEMASQRFFNKSSSDLTLGESATLAGQLRATTYYNPYRNPVQSEHRRNIVIRQMEKYGMITSSDADSTIQEPLVTNYNRRDNRFETAVYFRNQVESQLTDILKNIEAIDGNQYHLESDALTVYTTLDSRVQKAADRAISKHMKELQSLFDRELNNRALFSEMGDPDVIHAWRQSGYYRELLLDGLSEEEINDILYKPVSTLLFTWDGYSERVMSPYDELRFYLSFLNAGFIVMHPNTGHILGWAGGIDHRHFPYDQVLAKRQPGSAFKPIVYAAALEEGRLPCDYERNQLTTFADYSDWTPRNQQSEYGGYYSLQASLAKSINTTTVQLGMNIGVPSIKQTAASMGIRSYIPNLPSIILGTAETTLLELTTAYTSFLNEGRPVTPLMITQIYNSDGDLIYDFTTEHASRFTYNIDSGLHEEIGTDGSSRVEQLSFNTTPQGISSESAASMVSMLERAVNEGTGSPLRTRFGITHAVAGKTGTTQNFADGWFIGFTPELIFGVRVGGWNQRVHFRDYPAYASQTALPIAGHFLTAINSERDITKLPDQFPARLIDTPYDVSCSDFEDDKFRDRLRNFFTGRNSDDPVVVTEEEEEKSRNIFRRLGRKLGISDN